jgi:hypothetical protein
VDGGDVVVVVVVVLEPMDRTVYLWILNYITYTEKE